MSGAVIGIDLGTTNTVVAAVRDGRATALADETGNRLLPSVVSFHPDGSALVGPAAKRRRMVDAANTIYSVKRLIGRSWRSEEVKRARERFPFELKEGPGQAALISSRGETYTLPEISAFVLKEARAMAERALGEPVQKAVVTVPANFNDLQRAATKVAGRVAGLEVLRILNEPTAAALAYGFGKSTRERIAVYDFGGGTFDVTYLDHSGNLFEVLATAGDTFLGGDDLDLAVTEHLARIVKAEHGADPRQHPSGFEALRGAAEQIKFALSTDPSATVHVEDVNGGSSNRPLPFSFTLSRAEFESIIGPLVEGTFKVCSQALEAARLQSSDFDHVVLVGGSTRIPLVRSRVDEFFGCPVLDRINPEEVVALGAAIQAAALSETAARNPSIPSPPVPARSSGPPSRKPAPPRRRGVDTSPGIEPKSTGSPSSPADPDSGARAPFSTGVGLGPARKKAITDGGLGPDARRQIRTEPGLDAEASKAAKAPQDASTIVSAEPPPPAFAPPSFPPVADLPSPVPPRGPAAQAPAARDTAARDTTPRGAPRTDDSAAAALPLVHPSEHSLPAIVVPKVNETNAGGAGLPELSVDPTAVGMPASLRQRYGDLPLSMPERDAPAKVVEQSQSAPGARSPSNFSDGVPRMPKEPAIQRPPAPVHPGQIAGAPRSASPILVDVTPLSLHVETVAGYCDTLVGRNTPVPCAESRRFVTASDGQTVVHVRVSQGESSRFSENTLLGAVELAGLHAAPRGKTSVEVTFSLDTDGILNVRATDVATGSEARATLRLIGTPEAAGIHATTAG